MSQAPGRTVPGRSASGGRRRPARSIRRGWDCELAPQATLVGVLLNPNVEDFQFRVAEVQEAARTVGLQIHVLRATAGPEIAAAFAALSRIRAGALVVGANASSEPGASKSLRWLRATRFPRSMTGVNTPPRGAW